MPLARRTARAGRDRRGALHLRLGPRLPARLPADRSPRRRLRVGRRAGARLHGDRQRPGRAATSREQLGATLTTFRGPLGRDGLALGVLRLPRQAERLAWLAAAHPERCPARASSTASPCATPRTSPIGCAANGIDVDRRTSAPLDGDERERLEERLQANEIKVLVATTALGMGYDKPDLGFVVHFQMPGSPVGYYQQVGRAGRALDTQRRRAALRPWRTPTSGLWFIDTAFPRPDDVDAVLAAFDRAGGPLSLQTADRTGRHPARPARVGAQAARRRGRAPPRRRADVTSGRLQPWTYPTERVEGVTGARRNEQQLMFDYLDHRALPHAVPHRPARRPARSSRAACATTARASRRRSNFRPTCWSPPRSFLRNRPLVIAPKRQGVPVAIASRRGGCSPGGATPDGRARP